MSITCDQLQDHYSDYFEHILGSEEVISFERHLASCDTCRSDYHVFATMFQFLDRIEVTEVEAPIGLRAEILTQISQRPAQKSFSLKEVLEGLFMRPQVMWGTGLATAALIVVGVLAAVHPLQKSTTTTTVAGGLGISAPATTLTNLVPPLVQTVVLKQGADGNDYEYFTLHTPPSLAGTANVSAYVLQDGSPLADASLESDTDKASPAWSGSIEPNVSVNLPVSVTSDVQPGTTLNLLLDWTPQDNLSAGGRDVTFVPITEAPATTAPIASGTSFYDAVSTIAGDYHQTIVADTSALNEIPKLSTLPASSGNELTAEDALNAVLSTNGFTITEQPGGYYLISHP